MTKQLPQEIQEAIKELIAEMDFIKFHSDTRYANWDELKKTMRNNIIVHLQPYLSLPQQEEPKQIDRLWIFWQETATDYKAREKINELIDTINSLLSKTKDE